MAFINAGHFFAHIFTLLYATAVLYLPSVFGLPYGEMLALSSPGLILFGVLALPAGWLGDRWSKIGMLIIFFIGVGTGAIVTAMASNTTGLLIGLTLLGAFASIYHPVGTALLVACARKQGMALGINGVFGSAGSAAAPVFVGLMIDHVTWRAAFLAPGVIAIATGVALALAWRAGMVVDMHADRDQSVQPESAPFIRVGSVLTVTMACNGIVYAGMMNTIPKLFESGLSDMLSGGYTQIGLFAGAVIGLSSVCSVLGGWLADRYSPRTIYMVFWGLCIAPLLLIPTVSGIALLVIALLALSLNVTFAAAENMLVARYTPFKWRAMAYGARFILALGIGGVTVRVAGEMYDATGGFDLVYLVFAGAAIVATIGAAIFPKPRLQVASAT